MSIDSSGLAESLLLALAELESPDGSPPGEAQAEFFRERGVKGVPYRSAGCPVARWLSARTGVPWLTGPTMAYQNLAVSAMVVHMPLQVRHFVTAFDQGSWPDLVDTECLLADAANAGLDLHVVWRVRDRIEALMKAAHTPSEDRGVGDDG